MTAFLASQLLGAQIIEAPKLEIIDSQLDKIDSNTLIAIDVDYTLLVPVDQVLKPQAQTYLNQFIEERMKKLPPEKGAYLSSKALLKSKMALVNKNIIPLLEKIKKKGAKAIAFTAMNTGRYGLIESMEDWRYEQLKAFGLDFGDFFGFHTFTHFEGQDTNPLIKKGILCAADYPKGKVLKSFLEQVNFKPSKIIFIDDRRDFIESVENEITETELLSFHYTESSHLPFAFDEEIASFQLNYLLEEEEWLSDEEAKKLFK